MRSATGTICARASMLRIVAATPSFIPALVDEPLIFVEVALTRAIPARDRSDPVRAP